MGGVGPREGVTNNEAVKPATIARPGRAHVKDPQHVVGARDEVPVLQSEVLGEAGPKAGAANQLARRKHPQYT